VHKSFKCLNLKQNTCLGIVIVVRGLVDYKIVANYKKYKKYNTHMTEIWKPNKLDNSDFGRKIECDSFSQ
jgi:hypothetical protein